MARQTAQDAEFLKLSAQLLSRLEADSRFAKKFGRDRAAALQELFPQLKRVRKAKIVAELEAADKSLMKLATASFDPNVTALSGFLSSASKLLTKVAKTKAAQNVATVLITSVTGSLVAYLLSAAREPTPE